MYNYYKNKQSHQPALELEGFTDPSADDNKKLLRTEAFHRSAMIGDVKYKIALSLLKGGESFHGKVEVNFELNYVSEDIFLDYKGRLVKYVECNGQKVTKR